jgi:hypothetical protein
MHTTKKKSNPHVLMRRSQVQLCRTCEKSAKRSARKTKKPFKKKPASVQCSDRFGPDRNVDVSLRTAHRKIVFYGKRNLRSSRRNTQKALMAKEGACSPSRIGHQVGTRIIRGIPDGRLWQRARSAAIFDHHWLARRRHHPRTGCTGAATRRVNK